MEDLINHLDVELERFNSLYSSTKSVNNVTQCAHQIVECAIKFLTSLSDSDNIHPSLSIFQHPVNLCDDEEFKDNSYYFQRIRFAFNVLLETRIINQQNVVDTLLSHLPHMKSKIARSITIKVVARFMPYLSPLQPNYDELSGTVEDRDQQEKSVACVLKTLVSLDVNTSDIVSTIFPTLFSMHFYSSSCLCELFDVLEKMIHRISLQDWVLVIQTIGHLCSNFKKLECDPSDDLSERVKRIICSVREEWLVLEMPSSRQLPSLTYLDHDTRRIHIDICECIITLLVQNTLVAKIYMGILKPMTWYGQKSCWSTIDIFAMITLFSRCDQLQTDVKVFIHKLCVCGRFPFRYLSDVINLLLREPISQESVVESRGIEATQQGLFQAESSMDSFQHQMSSSSLQLLVHLMVMPSQQNDSISFLKLPLNDVSKDVERLAVKLFNACRPQYRIELLDALISLTSPSMIKNMICAVREKDTPSISTKTRKRSRARLMEASPQWEDVERILRSIESFPNETSHSPLKRFLTPDATLRSVSSAFKVAHTAYSILLTLCKKIKWDDFTLRILIDRLSHITSTITKDGNAIVDFYECLLIHLHHSILVCVLHDERSSLISHQHTILINRLRTMLFSSSTLDSFMNLRLQRVSGLILSRCLVYECSLCLEKKDEVCKCFLRFVELTLLDALVEPIYMYWIVIFLSSICYDSIHENDLLAYLGSHESTYKAPLTKAESLRQLKIIISQIEIIKKISDWYNINNHPLEGKRSISLSFMNLPVFHTRTNFKTEKRMVLCLYSLARRCHSLYAQRLMTLHQVYWWLRFLHAVSYSYLHISREVSPVEWSADVWVFAALESPLCLDLFKDELSAFSGPLKCVGSSEVEHDQAITNIIFSILSLGVLGAILTNVGNHIDYLMEIGTPNTDRYLRDIDLVEYQIAKIYAVHNFCRSNLKILLDAHQKTDVNCDDFFQQAFNSDLMILKASKEDQESIKILGNIYIEIFYGDILFDDQSLWKFMLLISDKSPDIFINIDDPDLFADIWDGALKGSIAIRTLTVRHLLHRFEFRQISDTLRSSLGKTERINITRGLDCLIRTVDNLLLVLPRLKLIDIYGNKYSESSPLVSIHHLLIDSAQLLFKSITNMTENMRRAYDGDLFNRIQSLIGLSDDLICSSILLDIAFVLCDQSFPSHLEGLEYACWEYVSTSYTHYNYASMVSYLSRVPHSFKLAIMEITDFFSASSNRSIEYYDSLHDLIDISTKNLIDCGDFNIFRQKLLLYWGVMKGSGQKLFQSLLSLVHHINSKVIEGTSNKMTLIMGVTANSIIFCYELLLHLSVTSFAVAKPMIDTSNSFPYQDIQNYLQLFGSVISYFHDSYRYKEKAFRTITLKLCIRMLKICYDQLERCIEWRQKHSALVEAGRRSLVLSDPLSISHIGLLIQEMMASCVAKIDSMVSEYRLFVSDSQLDPKELKQIKGGLRKIDELSMQNERLRDRIQEICVEHSLHASSLELLTITTKGIALVRDNINRGMKRKKQNKLVKVIGHQESSSCSFSSHSSHNNSPVSILNKDAINIIVMESDSETDSDDSFGVIGRWGGDEVEDGLLLDHNLN